jgi:hypothetical protein
MEMVSSVLESVEFILIIMLQTIFIQTVDMYPNNRCVHV